MSVQWLEFLPVFTTIFIPIAIGIYQWRKNKSTVASYMLGGRNMSVPAILMAHISASVSSSVMLGAPTETYINGPGHSLIAISYIAIGFVQALVLLPVLYDLQLLSLFEYCELRFNRTVRLTMSLINSFWELTYTATVTYGSAMVISQFLGISNFLATSLLLGICVLYTTQGGYRGVIFSDVFQCLVMWGYLIIIFILGVQRAGGPKKFAELAIQSDRFEFFVIDSKTRTNVWNVVIGGFFNRTMAQMGSSTYQRSISLPTLEKAQKSILLATVGMACYIFLSYCLGFVLFATYRGCDPTTARMTAQYDLTLMHFVQSVGRSVPGMLGIFVAGILCGSLSSMASCLNNASGVMYRDFVQILFKIPPTDAQDSRNIKILCLILGVVVWMIACSLEKVGSLLTAATISSGMFGGAVAAVFVISLFMPKIGPKGVMCGLVPWLGIAIYVISVKLTTTSFRYPTKVLRVDECPFNVTAPLRNSSLPIDDELWASANFIHKISPFWYSTIGLVFVLLVSVTCSFVQCEFKNETNVDDKLLSPMIRKNRGEHEVRELQPLQVPVSEIL